MDELPGREILGSAAHQETGLVPFLLEGLPRVPSARGIGGSSTIPRTPAFRAPFSRKFPGLAPAERQRLGPGQVESVLSSLPAARIGLALAARPADVLPRIGWTGAHRYSSAIPVAAMLRSWEGRLGARLLRVGFEKIHLLVERPPRDIASARRAAAEHFVLCDESIDAHRDVPEDRGVQAGQRVVGSSAAVRAAGAGGDVGADEAEDCGERDEAGVDAGDPCGASGCGGGDVVDKQQCPGFLAGEFRGLAAQRAPGAADGPLQVQERDFDLPPLSIQDCDVASRECLVVEEGGQYPHPGRLLPAAAGSGEDGQGDEPGRGVREPLRVPVPGLLAPPRAHAVRFAEHDQLAAYRGTESADRTDMLHWTGRRWAAPVRLPTAIQAVVAPSAAQLWAFGDGTKPEQPGYIAHFTGKTWVSGVFPLSGTAAAALSPVDVWVGGITAMGRPGLEHWNGRTWQFTPLPDLTSGTRPLFGVAVQGIAAVKPDDVWADVSDLGGSLSNQPGTFLLHWNGRAWARARFPYAGLAYSPVTTDGHGGLWLVLAAKDKEVWFCHYSAGRWTRTPVPDSSQAQLLAWIPGTNSQWAVGGASGFDVDTATLKYGT